MIEGIPIVKPYLENNSQQLQFPTDYIRRITPYNRSNNQSPTILNLDL